MEIEAINRRVIGLDIHQAQITACALVEDEQGGLRKEHRQFGAFKRDRRALAEWCAALDPENIREIPSILKLRPRRAPPIVVCGLMRIPLPLGYTAR